MFASPARNRTQRNTPRGFPGARAEAVAASRRTGFPRRSASALLCLVAALACSRSDEVAICDPSGPNPSPCKNPLVLVPGLGASILDVLYEDSYQPIHEECAPHERNQWTEGIERLWPALADSFPEEVPELGELKECRLDDLAVRFDPATGRFSNAPGVRVRPRGWGCVDGISNLFEFDLEGRVLVHPTMSSVYEELIDDLIQKRDYVVGQSLFGAPYDFRLVADEIYLREYFAKLKALIELAYDKTASCDSGPKRVFVGTHSLGGPVFLYFLNTYVDAAWKQKYIRAFISVGSPWTGSPKAIRALLSGDSEGMEGDNLEFLSAERLMGGLLWMAPYQAFHADRAFVSVGGEEYGVDPDDVRNLFAEIGGRPHQAHLLNTVLAPRGQTVEDPGVLLGCLYGTGLPTEAHFTYADASFEEDPVIDRHVTGDGTVTLDVLEYCKRWQRVVPRAFEGGEHLGLLHQEDFREYVTMLLDDCWSEQPDRPRNPHCPQVPSGAAPGER
jgi:hypothetical protein